MQSQKFVDLCSLKSLWTYAISKIEFFHFSGTERVKQNFLKNEDHSKPSILVNQITFQVSSTKAENLFDLSLKIKFSCSLYAAGWMTVPTYLRAAIFQKR